MPQCKNIILISLFLALAAYGQQLQRIAILGTEDDGEPPIKILEQTHLTDKLREIASNILPSSRYGVMTQQSIVDMLGSQEQAAKICREATCLADLGRKVNADYIAQARIGRFGGNLTIKVELYNVGSGNLIGSVTGDSKNVQGLLAVLGNKAPALFGKMFEVKVEAAKPKPIDKPKVQETSVVDSKEQQKISVGTYGIIPKNICLNKIVNLIDSLELRTSADAGLIPIDTAGFCFGFPMYFYKYENYSFIRFLDHTLYCRDDESCQPLRDLVKKRKKDLTKRETDSLIGINLLYRKNSIREFFRENKYGNFKDDEGNEIDISKNETCLYINKEKGRDVYCVKNSKGVREFRYSDEMSNAVLIENSKGKISRAVLEFEWSSEKYKLHGYYKNSDFFIDKEIMWPLLQPIMRYFSGFEQFTQDGEYCMEYETDSACEDEKKEGIKYCVNKKENNCVDKEKAWIKGGLSVVGQVNKDCQSHGWQKAKTCDGNWTWTCYINGREAEPADCKGFSKW